MFSNLTELNQAIGACTGCPLARTRTNVVCGCGPTEPPVFLLGEAPGGGEDLSGKPFCGQAGKELDEFLHFLGLSRDSIYIGNVVKCRPTRPSERGRYGSFANRKPALKEIKACAHWLDAEISLVRPKILVTLGGVPLSRVMGRTEKVGDFRGRSFFSDRYGCPVFSLYHPASVIYDRGKKEIYFGDIAKLKEYMEQMNR